MRALIAAAVGRARAILLLLGILLVLGAISYVTIPKEASPEIDIPIYFVTVPYPGITSEDAERLLLRPLERELQSVAGLDEMRSWAGEGFAMLRLDFEPGWDSSRAMADVREQVDQTEPELPEEAEEPQVAEVDVSLFPVLTATLSGPVDERTLLETARDLRDRLESRPGILEVDIGGEREDVMEILVDPLVMESYNLSYADLTAAIQRNNLLVTAGSMDTGAGRISVKVPGTIEGPDAVENIALRSREGTVVRVGDVAEVRQTYKDPDSFARVDGNPALSLEIRKRSGANILEVVDEARAVIEEARQRAPEALDVRYLQDAAEDVADFLGDLENNVITAVLLVVLVIVAALGVRASLLVAVAIPGAFLGGILALDLLGFTLNLVVLFSLILVVGMLVDGAVVVAELADRHIAGGQPRQAAYRDAAARMAWPVTTAIATTLAVFFPMLFWPGVVGEFIVYLPATVIATLLLSLAMALIFVPTLGSVAGPRRALNPVMTRQIRAAEAGRWEELGRVNRAYVDTLAAACRRPGRTLLAVAAVTAAVYTAWAAHGRGVSFFPDIEPRFAQIQIQARGDLSVWEADDLVRRVEERIAGTAGIKTRYARTLVSQQRRLEGDLAEDVIGIIQLELTDWRTRPPATAILEALRDRLADLPGLKIQVREQERGPTSGKPVVVEVRGEDEQRLTAAVEEVRQRMEEAGGFTDVEDDRPPPGVEVELRVDREEAARHGVDIALLGQGLQTLTEGTLLGTYHPEFTDEAVDIRLRLPTDARHLQQLATLRLPTEQGLVPLRNFAELEPVPATGLIKRRDANRAHTVEADVASGELVDERLSALERTLAEDPLPGEVDHAFRGEREDMAESTGFLTWAFFFALALMVVILVTQFNRFTQAALVLSAILFSTAGVLVGLLLRGEPFGVVMSGIGTLALAGIVVNNNIVLIDTYNVLRREQGLSALEAALRTGAQRARPVILTAVTTILGLAPMVFGLTIDFVGRDFHIGAPSTQFWTQLATAISGGLLLATPLTLLFTPAMLVWLDRRRDGDETASA
ncbi:MAG: efflux RND transporter permease subunit [Thiohalorhabdus sp.]